MQSYILILLTVVFFFSCESGPGEDQLAGGAPGDPSYWNYAGKTGVGTSYEMYGNDVPTGEVSRVWFSLTQGIITETAYGMIHEAQLKNLRFIVRGNDFLDEEDLHTTHEVEYIYTDESGRPLSLAYKLVNTDLDGKYTITKYIFTDPDRQSLYVRVQFTAREPGLDLYVLANPHMANTGSNDSAYVSSDGLHASEGGVHMTLVSSEPFDLQQAGFKGESDLLTFLENDQQPGTFLATNGTGNVVIGGGWTSLDTNFTTDVVIGFGSSLRQATREARGTLRQGYEATLASYNGFGERTGWEDYLASLEHLGNLREASGDNGRLLQVSAMVLKALEDKENPGALIASLSIPWGDSVSAEQSATGYRAVWPRDFYQCAMALLALGDENTARTAFEYLHKVQVTDSTPGNKGATGWFLQKTVVDGTLEWYSVQMDQTAMPIMLGWKLWKNNVISQDSMKYWYDTMLRPAARFLVEGGEVDIQNNRVNIDPPFTQQERWEEQYGYSPSTIAAVIAGLVSAADLARSFGYTEDASAYLAAADDYENSLERFTVTSTGPYGEGEYYVRISRNQDPNDKEVLGDNNARPGMAEDLILDGGFLELVRYGVRSPEDDVILRSIEVLDDTSMVDNLQVRYLFPAGEGRYEGWRRYGNDGYGEDITDGSNYGRFGPGQRGRVWPFFTGERGHYMLKKWGADGLTDAEKNQLTERYVKALEYFANDGLMLPEQVWDGVGENAIHKYITGEGTSAATPLAWTHAEYVKLLKSISAGQVWDSYPNVEARYAE